MFSCWEQGRSEEKQVQEKDGLYQSVHLLSVVGDTVSRVFGRLGSPALFFYFVIIRKVIEKI